jgi:hypothetical protein
LDSPTFDPPEDPPEDFDPLEGGEVGDPLELPEELEPSEELELLEGDSLEAESLLAADL